MDKSIIALVKIFRRGEARNLAHSIVCMQFRAFLLAHAKLLRAE
jgi:hypothetical protein